jgi:hypothetical protein
MVDSLFTRADWLLLGFIEDSRFPGCSTLPLGRQQFLHRCLFSPMKRDQWLHLASQNCVNYNPFLSNTKWFLKITIFHASALFCSYSNWINRFLNIPWHTPSSLGSLLLSGYGWTIRGFRNQSTVGKLPTAASSVLSTNGWLLLHNTSHALIWQPPTTIFSDLWSISCPDVLRQGRQFSVFGWLERNFTEEEFSNSHNAGRNVYKKWRLCEKIKNGL